MAEVNDNGEGSESGINSTINGRRQWLCTCVLAFVLSLQNNIVNCSNYGFCVNTRRLIFL